MRSIYIQLLVQPAAAPLVLHMYGYTGDVAITCYYPYPALPTLPVQLRKTQNACNRTVSKKDH